MDTGESAFGGEALDHGDGEGDAEVFDEGVVVLYRESYIQCMLRKGPVDVRRWVRERL